MPNIRDLNRDAARLAEWRSPPTRPAYDRLGIYPADGVLFSDQHSGTYRAVYQRGNLPTPGAMAYAYMSLGLGPVPVCGPGFDIQGPGWMATQPKQAFSPQAIGIQGLPTRAGQVMTQSLLVPNQTAPARGVGG